MSGPVTSSREGSETITIVKSVRKYCLVGVKTTGFLMAWEGVPSVRSHSQRRTGRAEDRPTRDKSGHRTIIGQSHRTLANRVNGPQGRSTPDRKRGMRYGGVSSSFSVMASNRDTDACCKSSPVTDYYGEKTGCGLIRIAHSKNAQLMSRPSPPHRAIPCP